MHDSLGTVLIVYMLHFILGHNNYFCMGFLRVPNLCLPLLSTDFHKPLEFWLKTKLTLQKNESLWAQHIVCTIDRVSESLQIVQGDFQSSIHTDNRLCYTSHNC
jgi:hypothetical protein